MVPRRRRSSIELEVQNVVPAVSPSVHAMHTSHSGLEDARGVEQQLEAADGGAAAWRILCAAFMFEAVLFGERQISLHLARLIDGNVHLLY